MAVTINGKTIFPKLTHIKIENASKSIEKTDNKLIELLYTLAYSSEFEPNNIEFSDTQDDFSGQIEVQASYKDYIQYLTEKFYPNLGINYQNAYILFEDSVVEEIIVNNYLNRWYVNAGYDGVIENMEMNMSGTESQRGFRQIFRDNHDISSFNELPQLTYALHLATEEFRGTYNLKSIDLSRIEFIGQRAFRSSGLEWFNGKNAEKGVLNLPKLLVNGLGQEAFATISENGTYRGPKIIRIDSLGECQTLSASAFQYNQTLQSIDDSIFNQITLIQSNVFRDCINLVIDDLKLPAVTEIGERAFTNTKIKKISELRASVKIGNYAFENCTSLRSINEWSNIDYNGDPEDPDNYPGDPEKTVALQNISTIGTNAFNGCTNLIIEDLKLPLLTSIGQNAFSGTGVKKVSNLGNITTIQGFKNCTNLTYVNIPNSVNKIGAEAFSGCSSLQLPNIQKYGYLENRCFSNVSTLPSVLYLPNVETFIGYQSFDNTNVLSIYLPNAKHTGGPDNTARPAPLTNQHRGNGLIFKLSSNPSIVYFKNIEEIIQGIFGAYVASSYINVNVNKLDLANDTRYYTIFNNTKIYKFNNDSTARGGLPVPINSTQSMGEGQLYFSGSAYSNIKYLIINNSTPPISYWGYNVYRPYQFGGYGLWGRESTNQSFKYLIVPSAAIETYKTWTALKPNIDESCLSSSEKADLYGKATFNIDNIKPLEKMHHVATKADWDNLDDDRKDEYLIEEYMGLGPNEHIDWQESEWWD